jgi:diguanylate cyclase (GGDEF)-like protein
MGKPAAATCERIVLMHRGLPGADRLTAQLALAGRRVVEVREEIALLEAVRAADADAVVLHCPVADVAAMDLPNVLRRVAAPPYLPVIVVAPDAGARDRCRFLDGGADDVVTADTSAAELAARVGAMLRIKRLHDQLDESRAALRTALARERKLLAKLRKDNAHLLHLATTDPLTHCQNLRALRGILGHEFRVARRYGQALSLLAIDVDHFKVVNDTHGHPSGDYVLKELAVILRQVTRDSDVVARTGGEEFTVLLPQAGPDQARQFAERIRRQVSARRFIVYGRQIHVTASLGLASYPADAQATRPDMLVQFADQALLCAKARGRDRVLAFGELAPAVRARIRRQYADGELAPREQPAEPLANAQRDGPTAIPAGRAG